ncbi:MAG: hypothetical protein H6702_12290 [Myxococcales bacterium]|nr:hypothetical protein [Myxococcales bacterium]
MKPVPPPGFLPTHPTWLRTLVLSQAVGERRGLAHLRRRRPTPPQPSPSVPSPPPPADAE